MYVHIYIYTYLYALIYIYTCSLIWTLIISLYPLLHPLGSLPGLYFGKLKSAKNERHGAVWRCNPHSGGKPVTLNPKA